MGIDPEVIIVNAKSDYKSLDDLLSIEKTINVGGTGVGSIEHIVVLQLEKLSGKNLTIFHTKEMEK